MTDVERLVAFVLARIAEDEAAARAVDATSWRESLNLDESGWNEFDQTELDHIARHDPARVLAECAAKRAVVERYRDCLVRADDPAYPTVIALDQIREYEEFVLPALAQPYAGADGWDEGWKVET